MKLSIIIVNYNVSPFLEQALHSVYKALNGIEGEVFVVDNNSVDDSLQMLREKFPQVKVIANKENVGFAKANNQAIAIAEGEYVLLLNPDTIVEEDTFAKCIRFMDDTPDAGGLGVKMVNGRGEFLPESKRGIPFPSTAFYKLFGLSKLFPNSHKMGAYHLTYLDPNEIHSVEVLSGAFMLMRKSVLLEVGFLDEEYFMYGEDIDLSYRILKGGYKNYYFPETRIIHYKGESTKKESLNYVYVFYKAMQIFARKHFSHKNAKLFNWLIDAAIWFRASLAAIKRFCTRIFVPCLDLLLLFLGLFFLAQYWDSTVLQGRDSEFPSYYFWVVLPLYALVWILSIGICKGYKKPTRLSRVNKGIFIGTIALLLIYALLPETLRFSRAIVIFGSMWSVIAINGLRYLIKKTRLAPSYSDEERKQRVAIVGDIEEGRRVMNLVQMMPKKSDYIGIITPEESATAPQQVMGSLSQITALIAIYQIDEVIFCSRNLSTTKIIDLMSELQSFSLEFKIVPQDSNTLIGSNSIFSTHELYLQPIQSIGEKRFRKQKRAFDLCTAIILLITSVITMWFVKNKGGFFRNIMAVIKGKKSWVGCQSTTEQARIPQLRQGVLYPTDLFKNRDFSEAIIEKAEVLYTHHYTLERDIQIVWRGFAQMGREV